MSPKETTPPQQPTDAVQQLIRELRERTGWSVRQLAKQTKVSRQTIESWATGKVMPRLRKWQELQAVYQQQVGKDAGDETVEALMIHKKPANERAPTASVDFAHYVEQLATQLCLPQLGRSPYHDLDVCLLYRRKEIEGGAVRNEALSVALSGGLEKDGCANWLPDEWWQNLIRVTKDFDEKYPLKDRAAPVVPRQLVSKRAGNHK